MSSSPGSIRSLNWCEPKPECTDSWLLRDPVEARWLVGRRSTDVQSAFTPPADPSHPHSVARDASNRCIRAKSVAVGSST